MPGKTDNQHRPLTVTVDGAEVPKALLTAFNKDKKPFSYFPGGGKPDLSGHPSPSAVRKSNPLLNAPQVPRVLPFVSDRDLEIEERRGLEEKNNFAEKDRAKQEDMSTLTHAQYNSPMPLYSKENVQQVLHQTEGFMHNKPSEASGQFNPSQSGAYRLLQENGQIAPAHSARLDEQKDEYPHYRGFVDPRVQSPSFKRLQYVTGMDSGAEDEISHELHAPVKSRTDEVRSGAASRQSTGSQHEYQHQQQQQQQEYKPVWSDESSGPRVAQRDPTGDTDRDQSCDPNFAARIAEAERPKVPPPVVPSWARKADEKRSKWQQHGEQYQQKNYEYQPPQATWQSGVSKTPDKWSAHYGGSHLDSYENASRSRSAEPYGRKLAAAPSQKKEWMKPYVAPNVGAKFAPPSQPSYSPLSSSRSRPSSRPAEFGTYYGPTSGAARPYSSLSTTSSTQYRSRSPYEITTSYAPPSQPQQRKEVNVATLVSGEALAPAPGAPSVPPWSKHADYKRTVWESKRTAVDPDYQSRPASGEPPPPWAQRAEQTHSLWQHEADAWRQRQSMETDLRRRATSQGPAERGDYGDYGNEQRRYETTTTTSGSRASPSWRQRPVPHEVTTYAPPSQSSQRWQTAPGGETKTQSSGDYLDRDGNKVSFTKEVYTSSDPGKEFRMLTEQEKKILEEPLQPGVVARHVTTKYYKKSTYNSSTTTSTSQTPPVTTSVTRHYPTETTSSRFTRGGSEF